MAARASARVHTAPLHVTSALASAALEWLLMCMLFLNAMFSYLVTKFASFCELQTPCLLCSRLDHIFGSKESGFYWDLICGGHKSEISSLFNCATCEKLSGGQDTSTSESCLHLSAGEKKSNPETFKSLVGKFGKDLEFHVEDGHLVPDHSVESSITSYCLYCNGPSTTRVFVNKSVQTRSIQEEALEVDVYSSDLIEDNNSLRRNSLKKKRDKSYEPSIRTQRFDTLSHIGYSELNITSESESEFPISDDDDGNTLARVPHDHDEDFLMRCMQPKSDPTHSSTSTKTLLSDLSQEKLIHHNSVPEPSVLISGDLLHVGGLPGISISATTRSIGHGLEELKCHQVDETTNGLSSVNFKDAPVKVSEEKLDVMKMADVANESITEGTEVHKTETDTMSTNSALKLNHAVCSTPLSSSAMDMNDAYKLIVGHKECRSTFNEPVCGVDSSKSQEQLKLLLSQISAYRGFEASWSDMSPRVHRNIDDIKTSESYSTTTPPGLPKRPFIERNGSDFESLDGSIVSEVEGEGEFDRLKRLIERDRKSLSSLYKELEEERSASAIAVNQAMAMINRLQEEKATMQMEALQYQRMMEEQAEYDQEALQKANELLAQRDKHLQDLEEELETCRRSFEDESVEEKILEPKSDIHENNTNISSKSPLKDKSEVRNGDLEEKKIGLNDSLLAFEDEKLYISKCLERLERKLHIFSDDGVCAEISGYEDRDCRKGEDMKHQGFNEELTHTCLDESGGSSQLEVQGEVLSKEGVTGDLLSVNDEKSFRKSDLVDMKNEISQLNEKLEALETDWHFLEHTINALRNGIEGIHFVQEIAAHLRKFRRLGTRESTAA